MTLYIYDIENGDLEDDRILVAAIDRDSNAECEAVAAEEYSDTDKYAWAYSDGRVDLAWVNSHK